LLEEKNEGGHETYVISEKGKILLAALKKAEDLFSQSSP
jgi:predicted transcriptional regulator